MSPLPHIGSSRKAVESKSGKMPWMLVDDTSAKGRLVHYLSGGGMRTFGRTLSQDLARGRHRRFFAAAFSLAALWLAFMFI